MVALGVGSTEVACSLKCAGRPRRWALARSRWAADAERRSSGEGALPGRRDPCEDPQRRQRKRPVHPTGQLQQRGERGGDATAQCAAAWLRAACQRRGVRVAGRRPPRSSAVRPSSRLGARCRAGCRCRRARRSQRPDCRFLGAGEEPVLAADGHAPHLSLDAVVVDRDATTVGSLRFPVGPDQVRRVGPCCWLVGRRRASLRSSRGQSTGARRRRAPCPARRFLLPSSPRCCPARTDSSPC